LSQQGEITGIEKKTALYFRFHLLPLIPPPRIATVVGSRSGFEHPNPITVMAMYNTRLTRAAVRLLLFTLIIIIDDDDNNNVVGVQVL
jgi:hypothetical protein